MKKMIALLTVLSLLLCGVALAEETALPPAVEIRLAENPTTGYTWSLTQSVENVLALSADDYHADEAGELLVGAGGVRCFAFDAVGEGTVTLTFDLLPPGDAKPTETRTFTYTVDADHVVTLQETSVPTTVVELGCNPTTGYVWAVTQEGEGALCCIDDTVTVDSDLTGAPSTEKWTFAAVKPGDVNVIFTLARPWEEGVEPADEMDIRYKVAEDGTISAYEE